MRECPHCLLRIIPTAEATCPACSCSLKVRDEDLNWSSIRVTPSMHLPSFCCVCNAPTNRTTKMRIDDIDNSLEIKQTAPGLGCFSLLLSVLNPIALLVHLTFLVSAALAYFFSWLFRAAIDKPVVRISLCRACRTQLHVIEVTASYVRIRVARSYLERFTQEQNEYLPNENPYTPPRSL